MSRLATFNATDIAFKCTIASRKEKRCLKCKHKKDEQNETTTQLFHNKAPLGEVKEKSIECWTTDAEWNTKAATV